MRPSVRLAGIAALVGLVLAGCGTKIDGAARAASPGADATSSSPTSPTTTSESSPPATSTSSTTSTPTTDETSPESSVPAAGTDDAAIVLFGETYAWEDGLEVTIAAPTPFTPSEYAAASEAAAHVSVAITIANRTGTTYDPTMFSSRARSGTSEADEVYDSENGFSGAPDTGLLDGRDVTFSIGFGVSDPDDLVLEVRPGFDYNEMYYLTEAAAAAPPVEPPAATPVDGDPVPFDGTFAWEDGLSVTVSAPTPFTPSEYATTAAPAHLGFTVTITNNTGTIYEPAMFSMGGQSGSTEAEEVYDSESGLTGTPYVGLLDGRQAVFTVGFGVADPADVVLEVRPGFEYDEAYFTG